MKDQANKHCRYYFFKPRDQILLSTKSHPSLLGNRKQQDLRIGPFVVRKRINDNAYELEGLAPAVPTTQNITFLTPFFPNKARFATRPPIEVATPKTVNGEVEWEVEAVTDFCQTKKGLRRYKVKWVGAQWKQWLPEKKIKHYPMSIRRYFINNNLPIPVPIS